MAKPVKIGIVGTCGAGKTELITRLQQHGFQAKHIAQEHSFAPKMWQRLTNPDVLIFLEVSYPQTLERKKFNWTEQEYQEQRHRLRHAIENADIRVETDRYTPDEIANLVIAQLSAFES